LLEGISFTVRKGKHVGTKVMNSRATADVVHFKRKYSLKHRSLQYEDDRRKPFVDL